jgi:hypothetical protein
MSVTRTFTVTVVSTGSGNKYFIDGVQQATLELVEGATFRFDQSDSSNSGHPLRFSTTSGGSHSGGSEYTTGVTTNGTPGSSGAYTQIQVASSAPTLYYYCTVHSGMGGQANTPTTDFWGAGNWSAGLWGISEAFTSGWGVDAWNTGGSWGQANDEVVQLTGQGITASLGEVISGANQGWGRDAWNAGPYGESFNPVVTLSGQSITSSVGSLTAFNEQGWGRDTWNFESWGFSGLTVEVTAPDAIVSDLGPNGWSNASYGENGWGMFTLNPADAVGLTGQQITSAVPSQLDIPEQIQGLSITSSVGSIVPLQQVVGLSGQSISSSVGSTTFDLTSIVVPTGQQVTSSVGSTIEGLVEFVPVTGVAATLSVGSLDLGEFIVGLTGQSTTLSVGSLTPADVIGLTGQEITSSVAGFGTATGFGIQAYSDVDTGSNSSYTNVATGSNTSYTDAA